MFAVYRFTTFYLSGTIYDIFLDYVVFSCHGIMGNVEDAHRKIFSFIKDRCMKTVRNVQWRFEGLVFLCCVVCWKTPKFKDEWCFIYKLGRVFETFLLPLLLRVSTSIPTLRPRQFLHCNLPNIMLQRLPLKWTFRVFLIISVGWWMYRTRTAIRMGDTAVEWDDYIWQLVF